MYGKTPESIESEKKFWADLQRDFKKLERWDKWVPRIVFSIMLLVGIAIIVLLIIEGRT